MHFGILGPLEVTHDGQPVELGPRHMRILLAALLCEQGRPLSADELTAAIWGDAPPRTAAKNLQVYVYRLRLILGRDRIGRLGHGYHLAAEDHELDVTTFRRLVARAADSTAMNPESALGLLTEALGLWRGPALAEFSEVEALREPMARLAEERISALEARLDLELLLGRHSGVVAELGSLVAEYPLREQLRGQHMVALFRCGRQDEAIESYTQVRRLLDDELGLEPTEALQQIHLAILRGDDPAKTTMKLSAPVRSAPMMPAQLPPKVTGFVGRSDHLRQLDLLLDRLPTAAVISSISGLGGVGKTALAVQWGHTVSEHFPDGQLYVNLRGHSAGPPMTTLAALGVLLRTLGLPPQNVPLDVEEAAAVYRSLIADRRMLILLDNAADADQVRPLLAAAPRSLSLVTGRQRLGGLVAVDGAKHLPLDVLAPDDAVTLIAEIVGAQRIEAERADTAALAHVCGNLPLALRIAAARLALDPTLGIATLAKELTHGKRLDMLAIEGDALASVRATFDHSYRVMDTTHQRVFRLLGLMPGIDFTTDTVVHLADITAADAADIVADLVARHLVEPLSDSRYALHDLVREYTTELVRRDETPAGRAVASDRLLTWLVGTTHAAATLTASNPIQLPLPDKYLGANAFDTSADAGTWLEAEKVNLIAVIHHTSQHGPAEVAWLLADQLRNTLRVAGNPSTWITCVDEATKAAARHAPAEDRDRILAALHLSSAQAYLHAGRLDQAAEHNQFARRHAQAAAWPGALIAVENNIGSVSWFAGDLEAATHHYTTAANLAHQEGHTTLEAMARGNLAMLATRLGKMAEAADRYREIIPLFEQLGARTQLANAHSQLSHVVMKLGDHTIAETHALQAIHIFYALDDNLGSSVTYAALAGIRNKMGRHETAMKAAQTGLDLARTHRFLFGEVNCLGALIDAHRGLGETAHAKQVALNTLQKATELGSPEHSTAVRIQLADVHRDLREYEQANKHAHRALADARSHHLVNEEAEALESLTRTALACRDPQTAASYAAAAVAIHEKSGSTHLLEGSQQLLKIATNVDRQT